MHESTMVAHWTSSSASFARLTAGAALAALCATAACGRVDLPEPPDMAPTVAEFGAPTASLNDSEVQAAATDAAGEYEVVDQLDGLQDVAEIAEASIAGDPLETVQPDQTVRKPRKFLGFALEGEVGGKVERVCEGWDDAPEPDPATNGRITFSFTANESALGRVVWGSFERCRMSISRSGILVELNGDFELYLANASGFHIGTDFIFSLDADVSVDGSSSEHVALAFRVTPSGAAVVSVRWEGGHILYSVSADRQHHELRDRDDVWTCDLEARQCESESTRHTIAW